MDLCPHGDSAEPQQGCVCRAQLRAGLTLEGRFPLQQHQPQLWQPWDEAQSQLTQREYRRARPWGQVGTEQLCPKPRLTASGRGAGGSMYTSPVPCLQGWEMCIPREALLPWQHQPHDTALCEVSGSAHSGHMEEAAQAALPRSESQHSHQVAHKISSFFFIEITIKN